MVVVGGGGGGGVGATKSGLAGLSELCVAPVLRSTRCNVLLKAFSLLPATSFSLMCFYQSPLHPFVHLVALLPAIHHPHYHHFIIPHQTSIFYTLLPICDSFPPPDTKTVLLSILPPPSHWLLPSWLRLNSGPDAFLGWFPSARSSERTDGRLGPNPYPPSWRPNGTVSRSVYFLVASLLSLTAG